MEKALEASLALLFSGQFFGGMRIDLNENNIDSWNVARDSFTNSGFHTRVRRLR